MIRGFFRKVGAGLRAELSFHFFVDVATLIASIATVAALWILIVDRPKQENIAAWQILQTYLQGDKRAQFNEGQSFALETLVKNGIALHNINARGIFLYGGDLSGAQAEEASFQNAHFYNVDLSDSDFQRADFENAVIDDCNCRGVGFWLVNLHNATLKGGDYTWATFPLADISGLQFNSLSGSTEGFKHSPNGFGGACYEKGGEPRGFGDVKMPTDPQGKACIQKWGKIWSEREKGVGSPAGLDNPSN